MSYGRTPPHVKVPLQETFEGAVDNFRFFIVTVRVNCGLTNVLVAKCVGVSCLAKGSPKISANFAMDPKKTPKRWKCMLPACIGPMTEETELLRLV